MKKKFIVDNTGRPFPYVCFKMSDDEYPYPVIGLFVNKNLAVDVIWENFVELLHFNNVEDFKAMKVSYYNECGRDVIIKFKPELGIFSYYVGFHGIELNSPTEAEYSGTLNSLDVGFEMERFGILGEQWIREQSED